MLCRIQTIRLTACPPVYPNPLLLTIIDSVKTLIANALSMISRQWSILFYYSDWTWIFHDVSLRNCPNVIIIAKTKFREMRMCYVFVIRQWERWPMQTPWDGVKSIQQVWTCWRKQHNTGVALYSISRRDGGVCYYRSCRCQCRIHTCETLKMKALDFLSNIIKIYEPTRKYGGHVVAGAHPRSQLCMFQPLGQFGDYTLPTYSSLVAADTCKLLHNDELCVY